MRGAMVRVILRSVLSDGLWFGSFVYWCDVIDV